MILGAIKKRIFLFKQKLRVGGGTFSAKEIYGLETIERQPPCNLKLHDKQLFEHEYQKILPPAWCYHINKALITTEGFVFCNHVAIAGIEQNLPNSNFYQSLLWNRTTNKLDNENYLVLHNKWTMGYYHWMAEAAPKLIWFKNNYKPGDYVLLLPDSHKSTFISDFLSSYKFKEVIYFTASENIAVNKATYISELSQTGNVRPAAANLIRETYRLNVPANKYIYISRANAPRRKVVNEKVLTDVLKENGFDIVHTDNMSIDEQISLFSSCKGLISIHGAGLTNMLFMPEGAWIAELRLENDSKNNCYFSLASVLNLKYYYLTCSSANTTKSTQDADFIVDANAVKKMINELRGN